MDQQVIAADKRWRDGMERWVRPGATIDPKEFGIDALSREPRAFVQQHHYSGSFPAARLSVGLFRKSGVAPSRMVGAAVFSVPAQRATVPCYTGLEPGAGVELGRFVCLPEVAYNGETWFLRRAFAALRSEKPEIKAVVSYSDPLERRDAGGMLCKPAHYGTIYQASNAHFAGRSKPEMLWIDGTGRALSRRSMSKIRNGERGWEAAARRLVERGADPRRLGEEPKAWLERVLREPTFRRVRHPGNFAYVFGMDAATRDSIKAAIGSSLPYPKRHANDAGSLNGRRATEAARQAPGPMVSKSQPKHR